MSETVNMSWCGNCKMFHLKCPSCSEEISFKKDDLEKLLENAIPS